MPNTYYVASVRESKGLPHSCQSATVCPTIASAGRCSAVAASADQRPASRGRRGRYGWGERCTLIRLVALEVRPHGDDKRGVVHGGAGSGDARVCQSVGFDKGHTCVILFER